MKSQAKDIRSYFSALGATKRAPAATSSEAKEEPKKRGRKKNKIDDEDEEVKIVSSPKKKTSRVKTLNFSDSEDDSPVEVAKPPQSSSTSRSSSKVTNKPEVNEKVRRTSPRKEAKKEIPKADVKPQMSLNLSSIFGEIPTRTKKTETNGTVNKKKDEVKQEVSVVKSSEELPVVSKKSPEKVDKIASPAKIKSPEKSRSPVVVVQPGSKRQRPTEIDNEDIPSRKQSKKNKYDSPSRSVEKKPKPEPSPKPSKPEKEAVTPDPKKDDKKRQGYFKFLSRGGPKNLGAKELPIGKPDCLAGKTFVITGVLDSFERDDVAEAITKYGGKCTSSISKKTSYVIVGSDAGQSKLDKAKSLNIPQITEDDFLNMLRESNPDQDLFEASYVDQSMFEDDKEMDVAQDIKEEVKPVVQSKTEVTPKKSLDSSPLHKAKTPVKSAKETTSVPSPKIISKDSPKKPPKVATTGKPVAQTAPSVAAKSASTQIVKPSEDNQMWVDKYRPQALKQLVGQTGDSSNAKKLLRWLQNWFNYHGKSDDKVKASWPGLKDSEGKTFKAALLSGPPGVGKTTTAHLVCKELGYDYFEMNASDTRSQKGLRALLSDALTSQSLFYGNKSDAVLARKHVVIMDEVDGMSGNEDRGGCQELLALIKSSRVPIICICNDRNEQKIRTLASYCFDLRFSKPRNEQLKGFVHSICFKEKLKIPTETLQRLIIGSDQDIRQIVHQLQLFKETSSPQAYDPRKDIRLTNWDVIRKVFSVQEHEKMNINDKMSLFFQDYNFGPLFVQENYLRCVPLHAKGDKKKTMEAIRLAAESLALGDITERAIRSSNNWSLLSVQAVFASLLPGEYMEGYGGPVDFPQWFGKNSNRNKRSRLIQQLHTHMHLNVSGSLEALNMEYAPYLRRSIVNRLAAGEPDEAADLMKSYDLIREDLDNLQDIAMWPNMRDTFSQIDSKTKANFTRLVNKHTMVPYAMDTKITKSKGKAAAEANGEFNEEEDVAYEESSSDEDLAKDANVKVKSKKAQPKKGKEEKASTSKKSGSGKSRK